MRERIVVVACLGLTFAAGAALAQEKKAPVSCADVAVAMDEANGTASAEQIAAKLKTTEAHVRECWAKEEAPPKAAGAAQPPAGK